MGLNLIMVVIPLLLLYCNATGQEEVKYSLDAVQVAQNGANNQIRFNSVKIKLRFNKTQFLSIKNKIL